MAIAQTKSVCVVGGGFSGLAVARFAASKGVKVTLYEATSQLGGRARTGWLPTAGPVELGATWFHGTEQHPVYDLAVTYGIVRQQQQEQEQPQPQQQQEQEQATSPADATAAAGDAATGTAAAPIAALPAASTANIQAAQAGAGSAAQWEMKACRPAAGTTLAGPQLAAVLQAFEEYSLALAAPDEPAAAGSSSGSSANGSSDCGSGRSLGQVVRRRFDQLMANLEPCLLRAQADSPDERQQLSAANGRQPASIDSSNREALTQAFVEGWACRERLQRAYDGFDSTDAAGLAHAMEYEDLAGPNLPVPGGYQALAEALATEAAAAGAVLHCNSPVHKIRWDQAGGGVAVQVEQAAGAGSSDSSGSGRSVRQLVFDAVVVTTSLGVLKRRGASLFEPPLPSSKWQAIQQLEIGQVEKLFVEWPGVEPPAPAAPAAAAPASQMTAAAASQVQGQDGAAPAAQPQERQQQQQQQEAASPARAVIGPRKPKVQLHDIDADQAQAAVPLDATAGTSKAAYVTYCLLWPTRQELWSSQWLQQQQKSGADSDPVYVSCLSQDNSQQAQQLGRLPEWLLGLHSWRYGDGPEWIKSPLNSSSSSGAGSLQQHPRFQPERSAVLWVVGRAARLLGQLSDDQVLQHLEQLLEIFTAIPRPPGAITTTTSSSSSSEGGLLAGCRLFRSDWCLSEFFGGSYSYPGPQATSNTADLLAAPLTSADLPAVGTAGGSQRRSDGADDGPAGGRVLVCFAGEATSRHHMGTVHGACLSGKREAERLLQAWGL